MHFVAYISKQTWQRSTIRPLLLIVQFVTSSVLPSFNCWLNLLIVLSDTLSSNYRLLGKYVSEMENKKYAIVYTPPYVMNKATVLALLQSAG